MAPSADQGRLRVLTLNLWARAGSWEERRRALTDGLRQLRPDLVAFQESILDEGYDQALDVLGEGFHVAHQAARATDGMGTSIASRWPIRRTSELDLHLTPRTGEFPCAAVAAEIDAPEPFGRLLLVNHFPSYQLDLEAERELQAVAASRFIDELVGGRPMHVILAGDLDADPDASSIRFWTGRHALDGTSVCYRDAWASAHGEESGHTFTPGNPLVAQASPGWPFRRIDYLFVRCGPHGPTLDISACRLAFDQPVAGVWASDHFGVVADLVPTGSQPQANQS